MPEMLTPTSRAFSNIDIASSTPSDAHWRLSRGLQPTRQDPACLTTNVP
jgi:hypothetical protein